MNTFFLALFRPVKTFNEVKATGKFSTMSLIIVLFLMLVNLILMIPITAKVTSITFSSMSLPENRLDMMTQVTHKMRYLQVAGSEILYVIMFLFYALLLYLFVRIAKDKLNYKSALQLIVYSYFIVTVGDLINTALLYARGLDAITNMYETSLTGLNLLTSAEQVGAPLYTFLGYFTPFQFVFVFLLSIGLKVFTETKYIKSLTISILFWLITILIPTLSVYYSQLAVAKSGIM
ncbi:hypothetical protein AGMMS50276_12220 [Synergistales bacterium]|nr:hypothetical protein AGMMS50276_12220 [Synergistales bacterium]